MKLSTLKNFTLRTLYIVVKSVMVVLDCVLVVAFLLQAGLVFLAQYEVEIPRALVARALEEFTPEGMKISVRHVKIRQLAVVTAEEISVSDAAGADHLLFARRAVASFDWRNFLFAEFLPQKVLIDDASLRCPAAKSMTGAPEDVLENCRFWLSRERSNTLKIHTVQGVFAGTPILVGGEFPYWRTKFFITGGNNAEAADNGGGDNDNDAASVVATISEVAGALSQARQRFESADIGENFLVEISLAAEGNGNVGIAAQILCDTFANSDINFAAKNLSASQSGIFDFGENAFVADAPLKITAESAGIKIGDGILDSWRLATSGVEIVVPTNFAAENLQDFLPKKILVRADDIYGENFLHGRFDAFSPVAEIESPDFVEHKTLSACVNLVAAGTPIALAAEYSPDAVRVDFSCEPDVEKILAIPQIAAVVPPDAKQLRLRDFITARGHVEISTAGEFRRADFLVDSGAADWRMVHATSLHCRGSISPAGLHVDLAQVRGKKFCANARVDTELSAVGKYRIQAFGTIENPEALDDYLGWFWWRIWKNLKLGPSETTPRADIDVYGTWDPKSNWEHVYGAIAGENALGGGVLVDKVRLRIAEEPDLIAAFDMGFVRGDNLVSGSLQWHYALEPKYYFRDFRFAFLGSMPPHDVFNIVGEGLPEAFGDILVRDGAGTADVFGYISGSEEFFPTPRVAISVDVKSAPGDFAIFGIEGSDFAGKILYDNGAVQIAPFSARLGEGSVSGGINVKFPEPIQADGTRVSLSVRARNVPKGHLLEVVNALKAASSPATPATTVAADNDGDEADARDDNAKIARDNNGQKPELDFEKTLADGGSLETDHSKIDLDFSGKITLPDVNSLTARGTFSMEDPTLLDLQIFGDFSRLLQSLKIPLTSFAFTQASSPVNVENGKIYFPALKISGESGQIDISANCDISDGKIDGSAVFYNTRFTDIPLVGQVVDFVSASTKFLPIKISGTIDNVEWTLDRINLPGGKRDAPGAIPASPNTR